jgi:ATP-dependent RNA helicase DDX35
MSSLVVVPTSKAAATQRAGRAGRTSNGVCYRLYSKAAFDALPSTTPPEIGRTDLTSLILQLKALGVDDLMKFPWVTPPPAESVLRALEALTASMLITDGGHLTHVGSKIAECPIEHNIAKMVGDLGI